MSPQASQVFARAAAELEAHNLAAAEALFGQIVAAEPNAHEAWNALAVVAVRAGDAELAAMRARQALELSRRNPVYLNNLGVACGELLAYEEAEKAFRSALKIKPVYAEALFNLGKVLHKQRRLDEALRACERAYAMDPDFPGLRAGFATLLRSLGHAERALTVLPTKTGEVPESCAISYAQCLMEIEGARRAAQWLEEAIARYPASGNLRSFHATVLLSLGLWQRGWKEYFWRASVPRAENTPITALPRDLSGSKVLLRGEQGLGDILFFLRFAAELRARGARVALQAPEKLFPLLRELEPFHESAAYEHGLWIGDLPAALEATTTPGAVPLHCSDFEREGAARRLAALGPPPYLGLTWRAGTEMLRRQEFANPQSFLSKEIAPELLGRAIRGWPGTVVALQRNPEPADLAAVQQAAGCAVHDLSALNADLAKMLAMLCALTEYVAVSNTNVHLMAGVGGKARVLVPQPYEWRWMQEGESPWFPGFAVYRQPASRDWTAPLARLRADLRLD
jgi:Tfp pilus assembly protein PilF